MSDLGTQASSHKQTLVCGGECERVKQRETETRKCVSERIMMPQGSHLPSWCPAHSRSPCDPEPWGSPCPWAPGSGSARSCRGTWPARSPSASGPRCPVDTNTITWPPQTPFSCWYWLVWVSCSSLCWNMFTRMRESASLLTRVCVCVRVLQCQDIYIYTGTLYSISKVGMTAIISCRKWMWPRDVTPSCISSSSVIPEMKRVLS